MCKIKINYLLLIIMLTVNYVFLFFYLILRTGNFSKLNVYGKWNLVSLFSAWRIKLVCTRGSACRVICKSPFFSSACLCEWQSLPVTRETEQSAYTLYWLHCQTTFSDQSTPFVSLSISVLYHWLLTCHRLLGSFV